MAWNSTPRDTESRSGRPGRAGSHVDRYRQIAEVLSIHGLGFVIGAARLDRWVPLHHGLLGHAARDRAYSKPDHVRLTLEQLGPTFVKLGQALSTRDDLVPGPYRDELARLQDDVPPFSGTEVRAVIEGELGAPVEQLFASFDPSPLASASLGQVHAATLADGTEVVVKIRRPGVVEQVELDLEILADLAARASRHWETAQDYDLNGIVQEFSTTLRCELDYLAEGRNAERFRANFAQDLDVRIPEVYWETTTSRVLTLERMRGFKISDLESLDAAGIDRSALAARSARVMAKMVFEDGYFHADPHPGNLFIEPDPRLPGGRIGLVDFGMVGTVDQELRDALAELLIALAGKDAHRAAEALASLSTGRVRPDVARLGADLTPVISLYAGRQLSDLPVGPLLREVLGVVREHHLQLPKELALLVRTIIMAEGMGVALDPEFQLATVIGPYAEALASERLSPAAVALRVARMGEQLLHAMERLPSQLQALVDALEDTHDGPVSQGSEAEQLVARLDLAARRLATSAVACALIQAGGTMLARPNRRTRAIGAVLLSAGLGGSGLVAVRLILQGHRPSALRRGARLRTRADGTQLHGRS